MQPDDANAHLATIIESSDDAIISITLGGKVVTWNRGAETLYGYQRDEIIGHPLSVIVPPERPNELTALLERIRRGEHVQHYETVRVRKDGSRVDVSVSIFPLRDPNGHPTGAAIIARDITARRDMEAAQASLLQHAERTEARFRGLLESAPDAVVIVDAQGCITIVNRLAEAIFGYERDEMLGKPIEMLVPQRFRPAHIADRVGYVMEPRTRPMGAGLDLYGLRKDGTEFPVEISLSPLETEEGILVTSIVRDITERKRIQAAIEAQRGQLQAILEAVPDGILFVDAMTGELVANPQAQRLFGRELDRLGGNQQYLGLVCYPDGTPVEHSELASSRALGGEVVEEEERLIRRIDGTLVPVIARAAPIRGTAGQVIGAVVAFQDITALKDLERQREEWISVIAHDLRQPIAAITAYAKTISVLASAQGALQPAHQAAEQIEASTQQLSRMINDLLDVSRLAAGQLQLQPLPLDLSIFLPAVIQRASETTAGHAVELDLADGLPQVSADPGRLEQVLVNLLSNAGKYGAPSTPILVQASVQDRSVQISVTNHGDGIPPGDLEHLFTRFYRTQQARRSRVGGLGLGLYICQELVRAHSGRISVASTPGQTTTFTVTLPR